MNEKLLEKNLREEIKKLGGIALKFIPTYFIGAPDRLVLMPNGKVYWVELKSSNQKLREIQKTRRKQLQKLGFKVFKVDSQESLNSLLREVSR